MDPGNMKTYIVILLMLSSFMLTAQMEFPTLSPKGGFEQKIGFTTISITYDRPIARGRIIFGDLVPYKTLWRTGAGNCTKIKFDTEVVINNKIVSAGEYALFTIPDKSEWTIILNSDASLYGTGGYDINKEVVRFKTKAKTTDRYYESLTIDIDIKDVDADINISWEKTSVAFRIKTQTEERLKKMVNEALLFDKLKDPQQFAMGAEYYYFRGTNLDTGLMLVNKALTLRKSSWYYMLKTDILTKNQNYKEAIETLKIYSQYVKTNPENWDQEQISNNLKEHAIKMEDLLLKIK